MLPWTVVMEYGRMRAETAGSSGARGIETSLPGLDLRISPAYYLSLPPGDMDEGEKDETRGGCCRLIFIHETIDDARTIQVVTADDDATILLETPSTLSTVPVIPAVNTPHEPPRRG